MANYDSQTTLTSYVFYGTKKPLIGCTINGLDIRNLPQILLILYQTFLESARVISLSSSSSQWLVSRSPPREIESCLMGKPIKKTTAATVVLKNFISEIISQEGSLYEENRINLYQITKL